MIFKPHTFTLETASEPVQPDTSVWPPAFAAPVSLTGQITPSSSAAIYDMTLLEIKNGYLLMCDTGNESGFIVGSRVTWNGLTLKVMAPPNSWMGGGVVAQADHMECVLARMQFA